eukprot:1938123-Pyramimonas_sp.AAC.1
MKGNVAALSWANSGPSPSSAESGRCRLKGPLAALSWGRYAGKVAATSWDRVPGHLKPPPQQSVAKLLRSPLEARQRPPVGRKRGAGRRRGGLMRGSYERELTQEEKEEETGEEQKEKAEDDEDDDEEEEDKDKDRGGRGRRKEKDC